MSNLTEYFSGAKLYGDDFSISEIEKWFVDEAEGYYQLLNDNPEMKDSEKYIYHNLNIKNGYALIPIENKFESVLGIGSSYGYEFLPIVDKIKNVTIIEPSDNMISKNILNVAPTYVKPMIDGNMNFEDDTFDLITCFGTLHHIPNVSKVLGEIIRVAKPNGYILIREPIRSMGDWTKYRAGLTKNERGIPLNYFRSFFSKQPVEVVSEKFCESLFILKTLKIIFGLQTGSELYQRIDDIFSKLFAWNITYHPSNIFQKVSPGSVFYVLKKNK